MEYFLAIFCALCALSILLNSSPLISAFSLLLLFLGLGGIFFDLGSPFLAAIQVLVYAGAIAILFVFVLMLMNLSEKLKTKNKTAMRTLSGIVMVVILFGFMAMFMSNHLDVLSMDMLPNTEMNSLFDVLFKVYLVPFELATMLLFAAIIIAVTFLKKEFKD